MKNKPRLALLLILLVFLLVAFSTGITSTDFVDLESSSENALCTINNWYDLAWYWRKPITLNNSGGTLTDYQVKVTVNSQELISAGKMKADGSDIRFSQSDGTGNIPYWIESGINTTSTIIWAKVPSISNGNSTIYMYYSNPDASANSSLSATFPNGSFQDLFNDIALADSGDSSGMGVSSGEARLLTADTAITDISQTQQNSNQIVYGSQYHAQTFYATVSGYLTKVTIRTRIVGSPPEPMEVQLRNATGEDEPGAIIYATASRDDIGTTLADYDFIFNIAPIVTAGTQYAIVIKTEGGDATTNYYRTRYYNSDVYSWGRSLLSTDAGQSWTGLSYDLYFISYIATSAMLDEYQVDVSSFRQVYNNNWSGQSFIAGTSGNLTMAAVKAYSTGSPSGNLTMELRDAVQTVVETIDQSQASYTGTRLIYGNNWRAQTIKSGYSGDLSKITLRAYKTGNPTGALTVQLRDVSTGLQENEDQNQVLYSGDRQVYGDNRESQIFQVGASGNLSKVTLRTAETGSPPDALTVELRNAISSAEENLDQTQVSNDSADNVYSNTWRGQTFQAELSGELTKATVRIIRNDNDDQSQITYSGDRQVYGDNWSSQIFTAGVSGSLGQAVLRASKTGSPPNDLTVELRNAVISYEDTEDQSQTSYSGDRQVYGNNWASQIFYPIISGNLSSVTLRSSITGSVSENLTLELRDITGGEIADQSQTQVNAARTVYDVRYTGQTFTANITGALTKVTIKFRKVGLPPNPFVVQIRDASGNLPGSTVYASANMSPGDISTAYTDYDFIFDSPASVTASTQYSIVLLTSGGDDSNYYQPRHQNTDVYAGGRRSQSTNGGSSWSGVAQDLYFTTYVDPGALPGSTVYATASRGDITTAGEYLFAFTAPYSVSSGTQYALVAYTAGGDGSNYYNISYQNSDVYGSGRECTSANGGSSWTGSDSTDLYFRTYITVDMGAKPGTSVLATASLSTITTAREYGFNFSSPYTVTAAEKYAIVIKTTGGDAGNCFNVSYQSVDAYGAGRECYSANGGSSWTGSDSTDLYFMTIMGIPLGDITVEIRNCTVDDLPGNTVYASSSKDPFEISTTLDNYDFVFSSPATVIAGVKYSIVISSANGDSANRYRWRYQSTDVYANGRRCTSTDSGNYWTGQASDFYFETYVTASAYTPGTTVYATASRSDITTAGEYEFTYSPSYAVISGSKYALVAYTSSGNVSNYYNISYQNSDNYTSGRECYSTNGGTDWTGSDSTDLYFRTYITALVGNTPGTTVYATTSIAAASIGTSAADYDFIFSSPYTVTAETNYAIVIYTSGGSFTNRYNISYQNSDAYGFGKENSSANGGSSWTPSNTTDLYFKTYIEYTTDDYEPGDTVYASGSRNQISTTAGEYTFTFTSPYTVNSGTRYTLVMKTTGGDVSNCYNIAYQSIDTYSDGNESISSDGGSTWTGSPSDLWFKTYVDYARTVSASGTLKSVTIPTDNSTRFAAGIQLSWNDIEPANTDILHRLEYYTGSAWSLVPDGVLPGNSSGFDNSPVDISGVLTTYSRVRLRANLASTYSTSIPSVQDWTATYYYRNYTSAEPNIAGIGTEE